MSDFGGESGNIPAEGEAGKLSRDEIVRSRREAEMERRRAARRAETAAARLAADNSKAAAASPVEAEDVRNVQYADAAPVEDVTSRNADTRRPPSEFTTPSYRRNQRRRSAWPWLSYVVLVLLPAIAAGIYYFAIASDQYRVTSQFSVRGANTSPLSELGLNALPSLTTQNEDSYIVKNYIESRQVIADIMTTEGVDLRTFFAKDGIDPLYRIKADMPMEKFEIYWRWMTNVEFNSTTGNSSLVVNAFSREDAKQISELVLNVSQRLVNELSRESRNFLISVARQEVNRAEKRLSEVRTQLTELRNREQALSPEQITSVQIPVLAEFERQLVDLKIRKAALEAAIKDGDSPALRGMARRIAAMTQQLAEQRELIGSGENSNQPASENLSGVAAEYGELAVDEQFATEAYKTAMASLETALAEAQKKQRYFATFVEPYSPDDTLYPHRILNTILLFLSLSVFWLIGYFMVRSVNDHAI